MPKFDFRVSALAWILLAGAGVPAVGATAEDDEEMEKAWEESAWELPAPPKGADLVPFYVSATADNRFFVDSRSLSVGSDGVIRYTLVVETPSGVRNVSYEGMRCQTRERRLYAIGQPDGSWSKSRVVRWERVREAVTNRQHAALFHEYFCPGGIVVMSADEARLALRQGGHPSTKRP